MLARMSATPPPRHTLVLAVAAVGIVAAVTVLCAACARARREGTWVDTTPNGFVAAPVDPPGDAGAPDSGARDASTAPPR